MLRECRLAEPDCRLKRGDGSFAFVEVAQDHQPVTVGDGFQELLGLGRFRDQIIKGHFCAIGILAILD